MGMTIDEAIKHYEDMKKGWYLVNPDELLDFTIETLRKYQMLQAKYVERLKADMAAILEDIDLQFDEICFYKNMGEWKTVPEIKGEYKAIIREKINALKADQEGKMIREPIIAHSELTNEIYIVAGNEKYCVTEQAIKAVKAIKALEQEPRKGHWINEQRLFDSCSAECSSCHKRSNGYMHDNGFSLECKYYDFCPKCGSDNREVKK